MGWVSREWIMSVLNCKVCWPGKEEGLGRTGQKKQLEKYTKCEKACCAQEMRRSPSTSQYKMQG